MVLAHEPIVTHWRFRVDFEKIGWLTIDTPDASVNTLSQKALEELDGLIGHFEKLAEQQQLMGVVILSKKDNGFIAGADVSEFDTLSEPGILPDLLKKAHSIFNRIEALKIPVVAGIHGFCLGGGLELSLACHYRIAVNDDATRLGFPEVKLGIFPGFGGTGRSIRQAGPVNAMTAMLTGKFYRASAAKKLGFLDKLVKHKDQLRWEGRQAILRGAQSKTAGFKKRIMAMGPLRSITARQMRQQVAKKANPGHYPAPHKLIDVYQKHGHDPKAMIAAELKEFPPLMETDTARHLRRLFFLSESLKSQGVQENPKPKFSRIHVVGAGVMGGDIAAWCAYRGMDVTLQDLDLERIEPALKRAHSLFKKRLRKPQLVNAAMARLTPDPQGFGVKRADVVIEAIVENLDIKQKLFASVEPQLKPSALLASNTSSIPLENIATVLNDPSRLIGLHFFNPVAQLPLVEVIEQTHNDARAVQMGASFCTAIGKSPVIVKSAPGFLVNRVLMPYMMAAILRVENGEDRVMIDKAAEAFGMPMGPIELMDMVGLDIGKSVAEELGETVQPNGLFANLLADGKLGRKAGEGFYKWQSGKPVKKSLAAGKATSAKDLKILGRELVKPLIDECEICVKDGIVASDDMADIGVIFGTGFAPFLGGPLQARKDNRA